jgi:sugar phosphate isomerase/epimerase
LATTSYIIPAAILPNLHFLGPYVDEVELVLFESKMQDNLPAVDEMREMNRLAAEYDLSFNVHLPGDVFLGDPDPALRAEFRDTILRFYERTLALDPSLYTLHLDSRNADGTRDSDRQAWTQRVWESVESLVRKGIDPHRVTIENLEYPLEWVWPLVDAMGMTFCLDIGHLLRYGYDVATHIDTFLARSSIVHLHGVHNGVDHLQVEWIPHEDWHLICRALANYVGIVSLEVFSLDDLGPSCCRLLEDLREKTGDEARDNHPADSTR